LNRKPIKGYEGYYEVDSQGNVYSCKTNRARRKGILKPHEKNGYLAVNLILNGKTKHYYIHRLVAEAFIPNPDSLREVNHKDTNKHNNCVDNLEWCDRRYNLQHSYDNGLKRMGESHGCHKLTEADVRFIRENHAPGTKYSQKGLAEVFGVKQCTISAILNRKLWKGVV